MSRRNRARSLGAAAELGAELRLSERLLLQADLRWADLDEQASLLRSEDGLVGADAVSLGVAIGWHFR
jgi:outer membrane protein W